MIHPTTVPLGSHFKIFRGGDFCAEQVVGCHYFKRHGIHNAELETTVSDLLLNIRNQQETYLTVDQYALVKFMHVQQSTLLNKMHWRFFVTKKEHLDNQVLIRTLGRHPNVILNTVSESCVNGILRLAFLRKAQSSQHSHLQKCHPVRSESPSECDIVHLLGRYVCSVKKPHWKLRVYIFGFFHELQSRGTNDDKIVFILANVHVLRLAILECLMHSFESDCCCEKIFFQQALGLNSSMASTETVFNSIIENYKHTIFVEESFQWEYADAQAHIAIEKCNRYCKGKSRFDQKSFSAKTGHITVSASDIEKSMYIHKVSELYMMKSLYPQLSLHEAKNISHIHNIVSTYPLPQVYTTTNCMVPKKLCQQFCVDSQQILLHYCVAYSYR